MKHNHTMLAGLEQAGTYHYVGQSPLSSRWRVFLAVYKSFNTVLRDIVERLFGQECLVAPIYPLSDARIHHIMDSGYVVRRITHVMTTLWKLISLDSSSSWMIFELES